MTGCLKESPSFILPAVTYFLILLQLLLLLVHVSHVVTQFLKENIPSGIWYNKTGLEEAGSTYTHIHARLHKTYHCVYHWETQRYIKSVVIKDIDRCVMSDSIRQSQRNLSLTPKNPLIAASSYLLTYLALVLSPALCICVHPSLRLFSDSSGGLALSHGEDQRTGGSQSLALFRLTAGVIRLLMHWVAAPF